MGWAGRCFLDAEDCDSGAEWAEDGAPGDEDQPAEVTLVSVQVLV
jgi:hypothetical protein